MLTTLQSSEMYWSKIKENRGVLPFPRGGRDLVCFFSALENDIAKETNGKEKKTVRM